jgi:2'-hydroxyisoflavone reductase
MKILVMGGTQFIGRHVVNELLRAGHDVTLLNRGKTAPGIFSQLPLIQLDRQSEELERSPELKRSWDTVIDLSAYFPKEVERILSLLKGRCGRYVYCSTISVYSNLADSPLPLLRESDDLKSCSAEQAIDSSMNTYGERKAECERVALAQQAGGVPVVILRPSVVYGAHDHTDRFAYWIFRASRQAAFILPDAGLTMTRKTYAPDLAKAFVSALTAPNALGQAYNIADEETLSFRDTLRQLGVSLGTEPLDHAISIDAAELEKAGVKAWVDFPLWMPRTHLLADIFQSRRDLQFESTPPAQALAEAAEAFGKEHREPRAGLSLAAESELLARLT